MPKVSGHKLLTFYTSGRLRRGMKSTFMYEWEVVLGPVPVVYLLPI
jgi:hypothetical protein